MNNIIKSNVCSFITLFKKLEHKSLYVNSAHDIVWNVNIAMYINSISVFSNIYSFFCFYITGIQKDLSSYFFPQKNL